MTAKPSPPRRGETERLLRRGGLGGYTSVPALAVDGTGTEVDKDEQERFARDAHDRRDHERQLIEAEISRRARHIRDNAEAIARLLRNGCITDRGRRLKFVNTIINHTDKLQPR